MAESRGGFVRVNLVLTRELNDWLDVQAQAIQQATGAVVNRSEIVRAALAALKYTPVDLASNGVRTEAQATALLTAILRAGRQAMGW
jgi:Arc/MetJ-type ribon-helix-helix transcriptional regulator